MLGVLFQCSETVPLRQWALVTFILHACWHAATAACCKKLSCKQLQQLQECNLASHRFCSYMLVLLPLWVWMVPHSQQLLLPAAPLSCRTQLQQHAHQQAHSSQRCSTSGSSCHPSSGRSCCRLTWTHCSSGHAACRNRRRQVCACVCACVCTCIHRMCA
jgi:hypothetical protein